MRARRDGSSLRTLIAAWGKAERLKPGVAEFLVAAVEGAILLAKVTKDISVMEKCVEELRRHLTLYTTS